MLATQGYAAAGVKAPLAPFSFERRDLKPDDVQIDIQFCGICHSDIHQVRDEWGGSTFPMVPGHEITGTVAAVGSGIKKYQVGDRVGVGCMVDSCRTCVSCQRDLEQCCLTPAPEGLVLTYNSKGARRRADLWRLLGQRSWSRKVSS